MIRDSVRWLKWRRDRYENKTRRQIKALRGAKRHREASELEEHMQYELMLWQHGIWARRTTMLVGEAHRLDIPVSYDEGVWRTSEEDDRYMTPEAQHELYKAVRQEKDDRLTHRMKWVKDVIIPIVTFILGLMTAYIAMTHRR